MRRVDKLCKAHREYLVAGAARQAGSHAVEFCRRRARKVCGQEVLWLGSMSVTATVMSSDTAPCSISAIHRSAQRLMRLLFKDLLRALPRTPLPERVLQMDVSSELHDHAPLAGLCPQRLWHFRALCLPKQASLMQLASPKL